MSMLISSHVVCVYSVYIEYTCVDSLSSWPACMCEIWLLQCSSLWVFRHIGFFSALVDPPSTFIRTHTSQTVDIRATKFDITTKRDIL